MGETKSRKARTVWLFITNIESLQYLPLLHCFYSTFSASTSHSRKVCSPQRFKTCLNF